MLKILGLATVFCQGTFQFAFLRPTANENTEVQLAQGPAFVYMKEHNIKGVFACLTKRKTTSPENGLFTISPVLFLCCSWLLGFLNRKWRRVKGLGNHLCLHQFWKICFSRAVLEFDVVINFPSFTEESKYVGDGHKSWRQTTYLGCRECSELW